MSEVFHTSEEFLTSVETGVITAVSLGVITVTLFVPEPEASAFYCEVGFALIMMRSSFLSVAGDVTSLGVSSASLLRQP